MGSKPMLSIEAHEGTALYRDSGVEATPIRAAVWVVTLPDGNIRYGGVGPVGDQVAALALYTMQYPGLWEAVRAMVAMFEGRRAGGG